MEENAPPRIGFWIKRGLTVYFLMFAFLVAVELLKGHGLIDAAQFGLVWSAIATVVSLGTRIFYVSQGKNCPLCNDLPKESPRQDAPSNS